jgi:DNA polymerase-3 subunit delta'
MSESETPIAVLGERLCPWLQLPLRQLEEARASGRLGHGWLLKGPAGIGKINLALVFAHRVLRSSGTDSNRMPPPALDAAAAGLAIGGRHAPSDRHPDLHWLFPLEDKKTIGIEQVRDAAQILALKAFRGGAKVVIVEPAEAMTAAAANALLKTLEEPPDQTYLLLLSHQPDRLLPTIRSRCQSLVINAPQEEEVAAWLGDSDPALRRAALLMADRAPVRALALLESEKAGFLAGLDPDLERLVRSRVDPQALSEAWVKADPELALQWLVRRLQGIIRIRMAPRDSKAVTHQPADPLHNAWLVLPVGALFERLETAEKLLDRLGSGINVELSLHSLLLGLQPYRGRT